MLINSQGFEHFLQHVNNQDYFYETSRMLLVLDGCSSGKYSEVGTRLFTQLFSRKEENDSVEKFESNVKEVFDELVEMMRKYYPDQESLENEFIMENLLFTIIACFDCKDKFIVKMFGDGYIITQNEWNHLSYMKFSYGKCPPYFAYKYCEHLNPNKFKNYKFKTFEFDKKTFKSVGIASDGILPIVKGSAQMDTYILKKDSIGLQMAIRMQNQAFADDVTIAIFKGEEIKKVSPDEKSKSILDLDKSLAELEDDMEEDRALEKQLFGDEPIIRKATDTQKPSSNLTGKTEVKPVESSSANSSASHVSKPNNDLSKTTVKPVGNASNTSIKAVKHEDTKKDVGGK